MWSVLFPDFSVSFSLPLFILWCLLSFPCGRSILLGRLILAVDSFFVVPMPVEIVLTLLVRTDFVVLLRGHLLAAAGVVSCVVVLVLASWVESRGMGASGTRLPLAALPGCVGWLTGGAATLGSEREVLVVRCIGSLGADSASRCVSSHR